MPETVRLIDGSAFSDCSKLTTVNLNDNITVINSSAFRNCSSLVLNELPKNLIALGVAAFQSAGPDVHISTLPENLKEVKAYAFSNCANVKISHFGGTGELSLTEIGAQAFENAGNGNWGADITSILFDASVTTIQKNAFNNYAKNTLNEVLFAIYADGKPNYNITPYDMGFVNPNVNIGQFKDV